MTKKVKETTPVITPVNDFDAIKCSASDNLLFFKNDKSDTGQRMSEYLTTIVESVDSLVPLLKEVEEKSCFYHFSDEVKANGYASWIKNTFAVAERTLKLLQEVATSRNSYFFRKDHYLKETKAYSEAMDSMSVVMTYLLVMMSWSESTHDLIILQEKHNFLEVMANHDKYFNQYCFYGRCSCFQFCDSMATVLRALDILMASFSEVYYSDGHIIDPLLRGSKYWVDPDLRAKRIVNISQYGSVDFCKNFWFLGEIELMQRLPSIVLPNIQVNKVITLEPKPLVIENIFGKNIDIPIPSSHIGQAPIPLRLLSSSLRLGMETQCSSTSGYKYPSDTLVFHCHGGGFVSQSSRSHENYLRQWAIDLDAPILSVDYSLAPEAPYPRALEEIFYSYCWALTNAATLGTSAEKIVLAGDSAGANLNIALTLMCLEYGVRKPQGLFLCYVPVVLSFNPSPSRLLSLIDPLLPIGFMLSLVKAYTSPPETQALTSNNERKLRRKVSKSEVPKPVSPTENVSKSEVPKPESLAENGHSTNTDPEEGNIMTDCEEDASKPVILNRSCSTGVISRWVTSLSSKLTSLSSSRSFSDDEELDNEMRRERHLPIPVDMILELEKDPYYSPYFASDSALMNFPSVKLLTTEMDPFLDDCIMFAKKLKKLGVPVSLDILPGLCHGFLNFSLLSNEANEGSKLCCQRIKELINGSNSVADMSTAATEDE